MPLQIIPQQNQPVGLQLLGDTISGAATDYANRARQDQLLNRQRAEHLSDVESNRGYEQQQFDKMRGLQLGDEQRKRTESFDDAKKRAEFERRLAMLTEAEKRGLFDARQIGNTVAEEAALGALQAQLNKEATFAEAQPGNAQARQAEIAKAKQILAQKMSEVEAVLATPAKVDMAFVAKRAVEIAMQQNNGNMPTKVQVDAAKQAAYEEAQKAAMIQDYQEKEAARVQYQILSSQMNSLRQEDSTITSTFRTSAAGSPLVDTPALPMNQTPPGPKADPLAGFTDEVNKRLGIGQGRGTAGGASSLQDIQALTAARAAAPAALRPVFDQSKTQKLADAYAPYDEKVNDTAAKLADVNSQLARVQQGTPFSSAQFDSTVPMTSGPQVPYADPGLIITTLLQKRAALERQQSLDEQLRQKNKASLLQVNTPSQVQPVTFPSTGALQTQPWLPD